MEEKKNIPLDNELNDEELEKATGGYQPATQSATKPCASSRSGRGRAPLS